jgi:antitoxin MazE
MIKTVREKRKYDLDELLAGVKPTNLHGETDFGGPVGKEVW